MDKIAKAVMAAVTAGYAVFDAVTGTDGALTGTDWARVAVSAILAGLAVWAVPNTPADTEQDPREDDNDA